MNFAKKLLKEENSSFNLEDSYKNVLESLEQGKKDGRCDKERQRRRDQQQERLQLRQRSPGHRTEAVAHG